MPEIFVRTVWPDGSSMRCYSPSLVIEEFFTAGESYSVDEFVARSREALAIGSERVRARYGFGCGHALAQLEAIEARAAACTGGVVTVDGFER